VDQSGNLSEQAISSAHSPRRSNKRMTQRIASRVLLSALSLLTLVGCGGVTYKSRNPSATFLVSASTSDVNTNGQASLYSLFPSGAAAPVQWSVESGDNAESLGQGRIDATGVYTPPNALSQNVVTVRIHAQLVNQPADQTTLTLRVHPGFVQPLLPEVATLARGKSLHARAQISEVGAGSVNWSLSSNAAGTGSSSGLGTLDSPACLHFHQQYTTCSVTYTAPEQLPPHRAVYLIAAANGTQTIASSKILLDNRGLTSTPEPNQAIQAGAALLGSSGGNNNDYDTYTTPGGQSYIADCCGGTLGALVQDAAGNQYILSNNHVLAESDQARTGDTIIQPGLMDGACRPLSDPDSTVHPIGALKVYVPIASHQTNVDAALASVNPGTVNTKGDILELGPLQNGTLTAAPPVAGKGEQLQPGDLDFPVVKSGRTTGLTCSRIGAIDLAVKVNYYKDCAESQPYSTKIFHHQIAVEGAHFTDSGDSGALVLDARNARAIGLYFAGGTNGDGESLSLVNPIRGVLQELGNALGSPLQLVGAKSPHPIACLNYDLPSSQPNRTIPEIWRQRVALALKSQDYHRFLATLPHGVLLGTAAGASLDDPGHAALILYITPSSIGLPVPATIDGLRTQIIPTTAPAIAAGTAPSQPATPLGINLPAETIQHAERVADQSSAQIMQDPAILGVGVAASLDRPTQPALLVLIELGQVPRNMPPTIRGLRVRYMSLQRFHVTRARSALRPQPSSCALRRQMQTAWKPRGQN
jgi:hypothetical protein